VSAFGALTAALACAAAVISGCGTSRTPVPSLNVPAAPSSFRRVIMVNEGVSALVPVNWTRTLGGPPLWDAFNSGPAVIALWRYPRAASRRVNAVASVRARQLLIAAARSHDRTLTLIRSKLTKLDGAPTIVLDATEMIAGKRRRVRSFHVFVPGAEIVLEEYAPPALFHAVDHAAFSPLNHSLALLRSRASKA
jgi:hypothetical protein